MLYTKALKFHFNSFSSSTKPQAGNILKSH